MLSGSGVDVLLDQWSLRPGHDSIRFMESMVTDPSVTKVIVVSDKAYAEKADSRKGGVGTETQIISPEVYEKTDQNKFVALVTERDENGIAYLPTYLKSRIYLDMTEANFSANFEELLRWIFDKPSRVKPPLGKVPAFLNESQPSTATAGQTATPARHTKWRKTAGIVPLIIVGIWPTTTINFSRESRLQFERPQLSSIEQEKQPDEAVSTGGTVKSAESNESDELRLSPAPFFPGSIVPLPPQRKPKSSNSTAGNLATTGIKSRQYTQAITSTNAPTDGVFGSAYTHSVFNAGFKNPNLGQPDVISANGSGFSPIYPIESTNAGIGLIPAASIYGSANKFVPNSMTNSSSGIVTAPLYSFRPPGRL
jgi:TIR domain